MNTASVLDRGYFPVAIRGERVVRECGGRGRMIPAID